MASDAEIDLLVNASNALRDLERDLDRLVNQAEASADPVLIAATLDRTLALRNMRRELDEAVRAAQTAAPDIHVRADVDIDDADRNARRFSLSLGELTRVAGAAFGPVAGLAGGLVKAGAAAGTAAPLLAGVVVAVESILPAAALATSGLLTLGLASATVKIAMVGVGDAIKGAFDPDTDPEELAKAMEKLGPHARSFVKELASMRKGFKAIQIDVQNRLFANLDTSLARTAKAVLPSLHGALDRTADSLNDMAKGAAEAGQGLGESGILGKALAHSTGALSKLERVPGQAIIAFGQLAAASGPALEGLAARAGGVADRISEKLSKAFASGALEKAINQAIANIDQLGRIAGNVFGGIGNIINAVSVDGQGLFGTLEKITQAFEDLTASKEFQSALQALSETMGVLVETVLPLLGDAFKALLPLIEILAPPIQELIKNLGPQLKPIIERLAPVLEKLGEVFAELVPVIEPFVILALQLAADVLPLLTPLFETLKDILIELQPVAEQLAKNIGDQLKPVLEKLPGILEQLLPQFTEMAQKLFPQLVELLVKLSPSLVELSVAFADLLVKLTPLLVKFLEFQNFLIEKFGPALETIVGIITGIVSGAFHTFADLINSFVIPAIETITALLNGDFTGALRKAAEVINNLRDRASRAFENMKENLIRIAGQLAVGLVNRAGQLGRDFVGKIQELVQDAVDRMAQLPHLILGLFGSIGSLLFRAGSDLVQGLINGILSRVGGVTAAAAKIAAAVPDTVRGLLGIHSPSTVMIGVGNDTMAGLLKGIRDAAPELKAQLTGIALSIPQTVAQPVTGLPLSGGAVAPQINVYVGNRRLNSHIDFRIDSTRRRETLELAHGRRR